MIWLRLETMHILLEEVIESDFFPPKLELEV
jgi:hypothetical protein